MPWPTGWWGNHGSTTLVEHAGELSLQLVGIPPARVLQCPGTWGDGDAGKVAGWLLGISLFT